MIKKVTIALLLLLLVLGGGGGAYLLLAPNFTPPHGTAYVYIRPTDTFDGLCQQLKDSAGCRQINAFRLAARLLRYADRRMPTGRYAVRPGVNNLDLLLDLRRGNQSPVRITFRNVRLKHDLCLRLAEQLMVDAPTLESLLDDSTRCAALGFTPETVKAMFIPNTYEVYWNSSADKLLNRMKREYDAFWTEARRNRAEQIQLTPVEVSILASIVEEESAVPDEYPTIAGLYLNRLYQGMLLQADPTLKYAVGDFTLQRILDSHKSVDSPYNTYLYPGLPPGPLRIPSITAIDAVLNYAHHDYIYMCAREDFSGRHNFASTLAEHNQNARRYREELNRRGIY